MRKVKGIVCVLLAVILLVSIAPMAFAAGGFDNFVNVNNYTEDTFTDVNNGQWFTDNVKTAYELGLIKGVDTKLFGTESNMTLAEAITVACRLHSIYNTGKENFVQTGIWYTVYVDYAKENGIISSDYPDYNKPATRAQFAEIFCAALPGTAFKKINTVEDNAIPDVRTDDPYGRAVYLLYRAGVLTGNDEKGTFTPSASIRRCEVAAIISRVAIPDMRREVTLMLPKNEDTAIAAAKVRTDLDKTIDYATKARQIYMNVPDMVAQGMSVRAYLVKAEEYNILLSKYVQRAANACQAYPELNDIYKKLVKAKSYSILAAESMGVFEASDYVYDTSNPAHVNAYISVMQYLYTALKGLNEANVMLVEFE